MLHYLVLIVLLLVATVYGYFVEWNRNALKRGYFQELMAVLQFNLIVLAVTLVIVFFMQWAYVLSRTVILNYLWINIVLMFIVHQLFKRAMIRALSADKLVTKLLLVTSRKRAESALKQIRAMKDESYQLVGIALIDDTIVPAQQEDMDGLPVFTGSEDLTERLTQLPFDEVLIHTPGLSQERVNPLIEGFEEMGVVCHYSLNLPDIGGATSKVENFGAYTVVNYTRFQSGYKRLLIKRLADIVGGIVGLILTGILTIFLAPAIKLDSPGPVFFSQVRVGKNGRRFKIYKFRSMYQDAEERLKDLQKENEVKGLMFKMDNDPRVTKVGRFIRRTSLDEFPQFLNVLKGDMSLVGTRPPTEGEFEQYNEHYRRRLMMKPGLTGMWQVSGRSDITDFDEVVRLDLKYIDNWSLSLDFKILIQTVAVVFRHKGAK